MKFRHKKYSYLGYTYLSVPNGWESLVIKLIKDIDKLARPWWLPRFVANILKWLAMGQSIIKIKSRFWHYKVWDKLPIKCSIYQIKDKYGSLRFYAGASEEIYDLINKAEDLSLHTCESCGSRNNVKQTGGNWIFTYCETCMKNYKLKHHYD